jgi:hypothetical protein
VDDPNETSYVISQYDYYYDDLGRLVSLCRWSDPDYEAVGNNHDDFTYNDRNMMLTSRRYDNDDPNAHGSPDHDYD